MDLKRVNKKIKNYNQEVKDNLDGVKNQEQFLIDQLENKTLKSIINKYDEIGIKKRQLKYFVYYNSNYEKYRTILNRKLNIIEDRLDQLCENTNFNEKTCEFKSFVDQLHNKLD